MRILVLDGRQSAPGGVNRRIGGEKPDEKSCP
jgi:hypothetical protein